MLTVESNGAETTISSVSIGETELTEDTDYTLDGLAVTLLKESLDDLAEGEHVVTIATNYYEVTATITVEDTTPAG